MQEKNETLTPESGKMPERQIPIYIRLEWTKIQGQNLLLILDSAISGNCCVLPGRSYRIRCCETTGAR